MNKTIHNGAIFLRGEYGSRNRVFRLQVWHNNHYMNSPIMTFYLNIPRGLTVPTYDLEGEYASSRGNPYLRSRCSRAKRISITHFFGDVRTVLIPMYIFYSSTTGNWTTSFMARSLLYSFIFSGHIKVTCGAARLLSLPQCAWFITRFLVY